MDHALTIPAILAAWQFWATGLLIYGIVSKLVTATNQIAPNFLKHPLSAAFLTMQPFAWGLIFAVPDGFLPGHRYLERGVLGLAAGTLSHVIYAGVEKTIKAVLDRRAGGSHDARPDEDKP